MNAQATLPETLASVASQVARDFTCVLVDDGSTDSSVEISEEAAERDPRFVVVRNPYPGRGRALNLGVAYGRGEIVAILDADDVVHPHWLAHSLKAFTTSGTRFAAVGCKSVPFSGVQPPWGDGGTQGPSLYRDVTRDLCRHNPVSHSGIIIRREAILAAGGYDEMRKSQFDYDLWVRIAARGERIGRTDLPLVGKRIHDKQHFEAKRHMTYVASSVRVQAKAIRTLDPRFRNYVWIPARFVWSTVPRQVRMRIRRRMTTNPTDGIAP